MNQSVLRAAAAPTAVATSNVAGCPIGETTARTRPCASDRLALTRCPLPSTAYPEIVSRGIVPDVLTDQTSAHDALNGYVPNGMIGAT